MFISILVEQKKNDDGKELGEHVREMANHKLYGNSSSRLEEKFRKNSGSCIDKNFSASDCLYSEASLQKIGITFVQFLLYFYSHII